jgi:hypothetical protein
VLLFWIELIDKSLVVIGYVYTIFIFCVDTLIYIKVQQRRIQ